MFAGNRLDRGQAPRRDVCANPDQLKPIGWIPSMKLFIFRIVSVGFVALISFLIAELAIRYFGHFDGSGTFTINSHRIPPYRLHLAKIEQTLQRYAAEGPTFLAYHPILGWAPNPDVGHRFGIYNSAGIRSHREFSAKPNDNAVRLALFGDSYTAGAEVPIEQNWASFLEKYLIEAGIPAEVLNFGVGAYGMDQAYLRWKEHGSRFEPDIVIFGFQPENVKRNLNLFRQLYYYPDEIVFTKSRFSLVDNKLNLVNSPTLIYTKILEIAKNFEEWEYAPFEYFYRSKDFKQHIWQYSKFFSTLYEFITDKLRDMRIAEEFYSTEGEPGRLALAILREFRKDVERQGRRFIVLYLPSHIDGVLRDLYDDQEPVCAKLVHAIDREYQLVDPANALIDEAKRTSLDSLRRPGGHYSVKGNEIVARVLADFLIERRVQLINFSSASSPTK